MIIRASLLALVLLLTGCGKPLWYLQVTKDTLHEKMSLYPNDENVSWWYTGSDGIHHFFIMEKDASWPDDGYKVLQDGIRFLDQKKFNVEYGSDRDQWVRASRNDFKVKGSLLEQTIAIPNKVRGQLKGLTKEPYYGEDEEDEEDEELDDEEDY